LLQSWRRIGAITFTPGKKNSFRYLPVRRILFAQLVAHYRTGKVEELHQRCGGEGSADGFIKHNQYAPTNPYGCLVLCPMSCGTFYRAGEGEELHQHCGGEGGGDGGWSAAEHTAKARGAAQRHSHVSTLVQHVVLMTLVWYVYTYIYTYIYGCMAGHTYCGGKAVETHTAEARSATQRHAHVSTWQHLVLTTLVIHGTCMYIHIFIHAYIWWITRVVAGTAVETVNRALESILLKPSVPPSATRM
jgi:hypothetical protein